MNEMIEKKSLRTELIERESLNEPPVTILYGSKSSVAETEDFIPRKYSQMQYQKKRKEECEPMMEMLQKILDQSEDLLVEEYESLQAQMKELDESCIVQGWFILSGHPSKREKEKMIALAAMEFLIEFSTEKIDDEPMQSKKKKDWGKNKKTKQYRKTLQKIRIQKKFEAKLQSLKTQQKAIAQKRSLQNYKLLLLFVNLLFPQDIEDAQFKVASEAENGEKIFELDPAELADKLAADKNQKELQLQYNQDLHISDRVGYPGNCIHYAVALKMIGDFIGFPCRFITQDQHALNLCLKDDGGAVLIDANNGYLFELSRDEYSGYYTFDEIFYDLDVEMHYTGAKKEAMQLWLTLKNRVPPKDVKERVADSIQEKPIKKWTDYTDLPVNPQQQTNLKADYRMTKKKRFL